MINLENVQLLSFSSTPNYFDCGYKYSTTKSITINGILYAAQNGNGVSEIYSQLKTFRDNQSFQNIVINGHIFGQGKVISVSYDSGNDVRIKTYTASFEIIDFGDSSLPFASDYNNIGGLNGDYGAARLIESLSETFSISQDENNDYSITQSVNVTFKEDPNILVDGISAARALTYNLFNSNPDYGFVMNLAGKNTESLTSQKFSETYDLFSRSCSFSRSNSLRHLDDSNGTYSTKYSYSLDGEGVETVEETFEFSHKDKVVTFVQLDTILNSYANSSLSRCEAFYQIHKSKENKPLKSSTLKLRKSINHFDSKCSYTLSYSNDDSIDEDGVVDEYSLQRQVNNQSTIEAENSTTYSISGTKTVKNLTDNLTPPSVASAFALLIAKFGNPLNMESAKNFQSQNINFSYDFENKSKTLTYSISFTKDKSDTSNDKIKSKEIRTTDSKQASNVSKYIVPGLREIIQNLQKKTIGRYSVSANLQGKEDAKLSDYESEVLSDLKCKYTDSLVESANYSYNPFEHTFSVTVNWLYVD